MRRTGRSSARLLPTGTALTCAALLVLLLGVRSGQADEDLPRYGPVPADLAERVLAKQERARLADIDRLIAARQFVQAQRELVLLGEVGLVHAARQLARGPTNDALRAALVGVAVHVDHPTAARLLVRAAEDPLTHVRTLAAFGLGRFEVGEEPHILDTLVRLTQDARAAVRSAAEAALFASSHDAARQARRRLPLPMSAMEREARYERAARSATSRHDIPASWLVGAERDWRSGRRPSLRLAAARLLVSPQVERRHAAQRAILEELGGNMYVRHATRMRLGVPQLGYDELESRHLAVDAAFALLADRSVPVDVRAALIDRCVGWVASPVPGGRPEATSPAERLLRTLPRVGVAYVGPVQDRLRENRFFIPYQGMSLLTAIPIELSRPLIEAWALGAPYDDTGPTDFIRGTAADALDAWQYVPERERFMEVLKAPLDEWVLRDVIALLRHSKEAWALELLDGYLRGTVREMAEHAVHLLERHAAPGARDILERYLFEAPLPRHVWRPTHRLRALTSSGDARSYKILERALSSGEDGLVLAALEMLTKRHLVGAEGLALLHAHRASLAPRTRHAERYTSALLAQAPMEAVNFVKAVWDRFDDPTVMLRLLRETRGKNAVRAAVDFALEKSKTTDVRMNEAVAAVLTGRFTYRAEEVTAFWRGQVGHPDPEIRSYAYDALRHKDAPDLAAQLLARLGMALRADPNEAEFDPLFEAVQIIDTFTHQPWHRVEATVVQLIVDPAQDPDVRAAAAKVAHGKIGSGARRQLLEWLFATRDADTKKSPVLVQLRVARGVGRGAEPEVAAELALQLEREFSTLFLAWGEGQFVEVPDERLDRLEVLLTGIVATGHGPTIRTLCDLLFLPTFAREARDRHERLRIFDSDGGTTTPSRETNIDAVVRAPALLAAPVLRLLRVLQPVGDRTLAPGIARVLRTLEADGRLAAFPDLYLEEMARYLSDPVTGNMQVTATQLRERVLQLAPLDGLADLMVWERRAEEAAGAGDPAARHTAVMRALRIRRRRAYGAGRGGRLEYWEREGVLSSLAVDESLKQDPAALTARLGALRVAWRDEPKAQLQLARAHRQLGVDLSGAEAALRHAAAEERRLHGDLGLTIRTEAARLALAKQDVAAALRWLPEAELPMRNLDTRVAEAWFVRARVLMAAKDTRRAKAALLQAISSRRDLQTRAWTAKDFEPLRADGSLAELFRQAASWRNAE